ncbi:RICIN domain-containing protein [Microbacterium sp. ZOR0019]|uniref:RICIN domain-containing protein n=1 Tax=Microbacterium sp. ZOR0019 TaxID=1339233 RepID=UPI000646B90C|nr:RICIN domain-containing protein [Microbacterium sp. ZOR0019]
MTTTEHPREPRIGGHTKLVAAIGAVAAFLATVGAAPAVAVWSASATATSSAAAPTVAITQSGFNTLGTTFTHSTTDQRGGFTITNTGGAAGTATLSVSATGASAAQIYAFVWPAASVAACTAESMPANAAQGTWAAFPSLPGAPLAPGASITYCVRSWAADPDALATASGTQSMTATAAARLTTGSWSVSKPSAATMSTKAFYPLATIPRVANQNNWFTIRSVANTGQCLDASASGTTTGTVLGSWTCAAQSNQRFEIYPTQNGQSGIRPKHAAELSVGQTAAKSVLTTPGSSASSWRIEQVTETNYQVVHADTGLCLTAGSQTQNTLTTCSNATAQQFTLTRDPLTCSITGTYMYFNFKTPLGNRAYTVQNRVGNGPWTNVYTQTTLTAQTYGLPRTMFLVGDGTLDLRVVDAVGNVLYSGMTAVTTGTNIACGSGFA